MWKLEIYQWNIQQKLNLCLISRLNCIWWFEWCCDALQQNLVLHFNHFANQGKELHILLQYKTIRYSVVQYVSVQHSTVQYNTLRSASTLVRFYGKSLIPGFFFKKVVLFLSSFVIGDVIIRDIWQVSILLLIGCRRINKIVCIQSKSYMSIAM